MLEVYRVSLCGGILGCTGCHYVEGYWVDRVPFFAGVRGVYGISFCGSITRVGCNDN